MSVTVFGSLNLDLVAYADNLPTLGQTVTGEKLVRFPGGKGLNQAIAASRSGSKVLMVGCLGQDSEGDFLNQILLDEKIDSRYISRKQVQTGIAVIEVSKDGENRILIIPGANAQVKYELEYLNDSVKPKVALAQLETPIAEVEKFIISANRAGVTTILNPAPIQKLSNELIAACNYLIVNETEASFLIDKQVEKLNKDEAQAVGKKLLKMGTEQVVITLGDQGSLYLDTQNVIYTPAFKISAIDTTAAGDAFCGAFATAIANGSPIEYALKFATAAGAIAATRAGAVPSLPTNNEILSMLASVQ
jgi:ribokinase